MTVAKPADLVLWVPSDDPLKMTSPSGGKRATGWILGEKPAFETMNYLQNNWGKWGNYVDQMPLFVNDETNNVFGWGVDVLDSAVYTGSGTGFTVAYGGEAGKDSSMDLGTLIGYQAGLSRDAGLSLSLGGLTCLGYRAGAISVAAVSKSWGTYIGAFSGVNSQGLAQICLGYESGNNNSKDKLLALGFRAAFSATHGDNSIFIGNEVGNLASLGTESVVWIGDSDTSTPLIQGSFTNSLLVINGDLQSTGYIAVEDDMTAPGTVAGKALIYVDAADGDLKCKFGNGFVATIASDS